MTKDETSAKREIVLDTETTGLDPASGDRIVEIACVELLNRVPTGRTYQVYVNPERDMPEGAFRVHGLSAEFLAGHPVFADVVDGFLEFISEGELVIHNAEFDLKFLNAELAKINRAALDGYPVTDTVLLARKKFPGAPASLDALCRRFGVDNSNRQIHGALLDAQLLADVYLELMGGRQQGLGLAPEVARGPDKTRLNRTTRAARPHQASDAERSAHEAFVKDMKNPIWNA